MDCYLWQCITTTTIKVIANGKMGPTFNMERGIRQGDPLSPYIFVICTEYLGRNIIHGKTRQSLVLVFA